MARTSDEGLCLANVLGQQRHGFKFAYMLLISGCLLVQLAASDDFIPTDEIRADQIVPTNEDISPTNSEQILESQTNIILDETEESRTSENPDDPSVNTEEDIKWPDDDDVISQDDTGPLDWTTMDKGLQDLHSLINEIDEGSQGQNESQASLDEDDEEDHPSKPKYPCSPKQVGNNTDNNVTSQARIVNATELLELVAATAEVVKDNTTDNVTEGHCVFVMFYAPWCKFSIASAPHFNALGRAFPDIDVIAVDAFQFRSLNARYGTVSVPNFLFFYNNKPVLRYNYSERTYDAFTEFLQNNTGLVANTSVNVSDIDYVGPVPSVLSEEPDYALWFSGIFVLCWFMWIMKVQYGTVIAARIDDAVNYVRHIWRTGEFYEQVGMHDHEHVD